MPSSTRLRRALVAISTGAALLVALTSCTSFGTGDQDAARAAAEEHAHLVAAGDDLETLWATTLTAEPALVRDAGRMLGEASERIEVLHLSEAEPADMVLDGLYEADLDLQEARQVTVRYRLAGTEHESTVALAPRENQPRDEPGSWVVVTPLFGAMTVPPVGFAAVVLDTYIGEVYAQVGDNHSEQELLLYPAVYDLQQRADPYFSSDSVDLTVTAEQNVPIPQLDVVPTDETVASLADQLVSWLETCVEEPGACSSSTYDLVEAHGFEPSRYDWSIEVTTAPQLTVHGDDVEFTGGALLLHGPDGSTTDIAFAGRSSWTLPMQTWTPTLLGFATELREVGPDHPTWPDSAPSGRCRAHDDHARHGTNGLHRCFAVGPGAAGGRPVRRGSVCGRSWCAGPGDGGRDDGRPRAGGARRRRAGGRARRTGGSQPADQRHLAPGSWVPILR